MKPNHWEINLEGVKYDDDSITESGTTTALIDTSSYLIGIPANDFKKFN